MPAPRCVELKEHGLAAGHLIVVGWRKVLVRRGGASEEGDGEDDDAREHGGAGGGGRGECLRIRRVSALKSPPIFDDTHDHGFE